ncbi:hypothetical protein LXL04_012181 [Taraxacum kok-saghyz]
MWYVIRSVTVRSLRKEVDSKLLDTTPKHTIWSPTVPIKTNVFIWRARLDRLPTRANLNRRGVNLQDDKCVLCNLVEESAQHLLVECSTAKELIASISLWAASIKFPAFINSIEDLICQQVHPTKSKEREMWDTISRAMLWTIWSFRNTLLFEGKVKTNMMLLREVKELAYNWLKSRSVFCKHIKWSDWNCNPL